MPRIDTVVECPVYDSFRVRQAAGMFDLPLEKSSRQRFTVELPDDSEPWRIGVIVGPSGSGKSTVARAAYGEALYVGPAWPDDRAVIDCFGRHPFKRVVETLTAVGFSSPPCWLRPYRVLSGGEKFRCDLAQALLSPGPLVAFDEFTSVVDRTAACFGSAAVGKALRRDPGEKRFVAVTCHYDVLEWLEPDWVLDMASGQLSRGRLRRPAIHARLVRCHHGAWRLFSRHHYLSGSVNKASHCYLAVWDDQPLAFCAVLSVPGRAGHWRISRLVVLPDYQGLGIGLRMASAVGALYRRQQRKIGIVTSHPAMIAGLQRSPLWSAAGVKKTGHGVQQGARRGTLTGYVSNTSWGRPVVSFRYTGGPHLHPPPTPITNDQ